MTDPFLLLVDSSPIWMPALSWLLGQLSASRAGLRIEEDIKKRLKWIKDPQAEKAFQEAFKTGIERYRKNRSANEAAPAVADVLLFIANHETSIMDRATILGQIFADRVDAKAIRDVVNRTIFAIKGSIISKDLVSKELQKLITDYLRPAFRSQKYFAEVVGFAEVIGLLKDIKENLIPTIDLENLQKDYYIKISIKNEAISMQGISPKVQNRTIGIRMQDVFISLEAKRVGIGFLHISDLHVTRDVHIGDSKLEWKLEPFFTQEILQELNNKILVQINEAISSVKLPYRDSDFEDYIDLINIKPSDLDNFSPREIKNRINQISLYFEKMSLQGIKDKDKRELITDWLAGSEGKQLKGLLKHPHFVIQGHPGSGKSTVIKYISWAISLQNNELIGDDLFGLIPIPIRAIEFGESLQNGTVASLDEYILEKDTTYSPLFKFAISAGKAFVFIDGLDEVGQPALRSRVKERVDDFAADPTFSDNRILITTRIVGYRPDGVTGSFPHFELKELNDDLIKKFVDSWYRAINSEIVSSTNVEEEKKQLLDAVLKNSSIHRLAQNPLLLTIIALIKWQGRALPEQRVLLYEAAAQTLISSWPLAQREIKFDEIFIREWLAPIAERIFSNPTSDLMDEYTLTDELVTSMLNLKSLTPIEAKSQTQELLESISLHSGIILPRGTDDDGRNLYGFLHQTFAEYLTAYYLAGKWEDEKLDLKQYAHDPYWREVLLLMAGHLGTQRRAKAGKLLGSILDIHSSEYEDIIHRDLLLAGRILGDAVLVPADIVEEILTRLVELWKAAQYSRLRKDVQDVFQLIKSTEYGPVLARIAIASNLSDDDVLTLLPSLDHRLVIGRLEEMLRSEDISLRLNSATFLAEQGDERGIQALFDILANADEATEAEIIGVFVRINHTPGIVFGIERLASFYFNTPNSAWAKVRIAIGRKKKNLQAIYEMQKNIFSQSARWILAILFYPDFPDGEVSLLECLSSGKEEFVFEAARKLSGISKDERGVRVLLDLFSKSNDEQLLMNIAFKLATLKHQEAIPYFKALVKEDEAENKLAAAQVLFEDYNDPYGMQVLTDLLHSEDETIAKQAHATLRKAPGFAWTEEYIIRLLGNPNTRIQFEFAKQMSDDGIQAGMDHMAQLLNTENDGKICLDIANYLWSGGETKDISNRGIAEKKLHTLLQSEDISISLPAASSLARKDDIIGFEKLGSFLQSPDPALRFQAADTLLSRHTEKSFDILRNNLPAMLADFETKGIQGKFDSSAQCVADIAYEFICVYISPSGKLDFTQKSITKKKQSKQPLPETTSAS